MPEMQLETKALNTTCSPHCYLQGVGFYCPGDKSVRLHGQADTWAILLSSKRACMGIMYKAHGPEAYE